MPRKSPKKPAAPIPFNVFVSKPRSKLAKNQFVVVFYYKSLTKAVRAYRDGVETARDEILAYGEALAGALADAAEDTLPLRQFLQVADGNPSAAELLSAWGDVKPILDALCDKANANRVCVFSYPSMEEAFKDEALDQFQKTIASAPFTALATILALGLDVRKADCKIVKGSTPTACPKADPPLPAEYLPAVVEIFKRHNLIPDEHTVHWIGYRAWRNNLCDCTFSDRDGADDSRTEAEQTEEADELPTIWHHGNKSYSIDGHTPINVTNEQHNVLNAFLDKNIALDTQALTKTGASNITGVINKLIKKFGEGAIRPPQQKGEGYFIRVRSLSSTD